VAFAPEFSRSVDLHRVPTVVLMQIIHDLDEIAHTIDALPRGSAIWRSLMLGRLTTVVEGRTVGYMIDADHQKLVVVAISD
jgi:hypothetical protein